MKLFWKKQPKSPDLVNPGETENNRSGSFPGRYFSSILKSNILLLTLIVISGILVYSNSFDVPFQFDDKWNIVENPAVHDFGNFNLISLYNPRRIVGFFTFSLNYYFGGLDVTGYHIVNLAIHIATAFLVYFLVLLIFRATFFSNQRSAFSIQQFSKASTDKQLPITHHASHITAFVAALLFVIHPVQTQAVTYIVQRFTSLATMFYLLSVVSYLKGKLSGISNQLSAEGSQQITTKELLFRAAPWFVVSILSAILAMRTKEISFTLPILIFILEFTFFHVTRRTKAIIICVLLIFAAVVLALTLNLEKPLGELISDLSERTRVQTEVSRWHYLLTQFSVVATYIRLLFFPVNQNLDYDYPIYHSFFNPPVFLSFLFLFVLFAGAVYLMYKTRSAINSQLSAASSLQSEKNSTFNTQHSTFHFYRLISFGILWFFITLSIESSLIPIEDVIFEHRVYLPSVGFFIALVAGASLLLSRFARKLKTGSNSQLTHYASRITKFAVAVLAIIVLALASATYSRNEVWKNEISLWKDVVRKSPAKARGYVNLAASFNDKNMPEKAVEYLQIAIRLNPDDHEAYYNLGLAFSSLGLIDRATESYQIAIKLKPSFSEAHYDLAIDLLSLGMSESAIGHFKTAIGLKPNDPAAHNSLGVAFMSREMTTEAIHHFTIALRLDPGFIEARNNLARVLDFKNKSYRALPGRY